MLSPSKDHQLFFVGKIGDFGGSSGAIRPFPWYGGEADFRADPTVGPLPKI